MEWKLLFKRQGTQDAGLVGGGNGFVFAHGPFALGRLGAQQVGRVGVAALEPADGRNC